MRVNPYKITYPYTNRFKYFGAYIGIGIGNISVLDMPAQLKNPRELRGLAILSTGNSVVRVKKGVYSVKSQTGVGDYEVRTHLHEAWTCACPDFKKFKTNCKHIFAVKFSVLLKEEVETSSKEGDIEVSEVADKCPMCESANNIKRGVRKTQNGDVQLYFCKDCRRKFTIDRGFSRMKHDPKAITLSMDLFFKGISYRKICDHLKQFYELDVAPSTPMRWVQKYLKILGQYSEKYKADVGNIWHSDEMTVFIKKHGEKGYYEWLWNIMDAKTRYLLACKITKTRDISDARRSLRAAKARTDSRPDAIVTDGLGSYPIAIRREFLDHSELIQNPHVQLKDFETKPNNNIIERLNGTCRERMKVMRSLNDPINASIFADGFRTYYNYIRPHQALGGMTPAQVAGFPMDLTGNRWMKMIEASVSESP